MNHVYFGVGAMFCGIALGIAAGQMKLSPFIAIIFILSGAVLANGLLAVVFLK